MSAGIFIFAWFVLPTSVWLFNRCRQHRSHWVSLFILTTVGGYVLLLITTAIADQELKGTEQWGSDTGRSLVVYTGIPLSAIWTAFSFVCLRVVARIFKKPSAAPVNVSMEGDLTEIGTKHLTKI